MPAELRVLSDATRKICSNYLKLQLSLGKLDLGTAAKTTEFGLISLKKTFFGLMAEILR